MIGSEVKVMSGEEEGLTTDDWLWEVGIMIDVEVEIINRCKAGLITSCTTEIIAGRGVH